MDEVVFVSIGFNHEFGNPVIVVLACWLDMSIVEVETEVVDVLDRLNSEGLPSRTCNSLCSTGLKLDPVDRNACDPDASTGASIGRFRGEAVANILFGNGVGVPLIWEITGLVIGQRIAINDPKRSVHNNCHRRAEILIYYGVGVQIL